MDILNKIIENKKKEVVERKELYPIKLLESSIYFDSPIVSLKHYLQCKDRVGIIAEIKRKSPSKGNINPYVDVERISIGYMQAGASALSILTDDVYFGGNNSDLTTARKFNYCPILRKDFIVDEYQIIEAKSIGADAILLLANVLTKEECKMFTTLAHQLGLEVLLETHTINELDYYLPETDVLGINNRDLKTFTVDIERSLKLAAHLPDNVVKVSESGIKTADDILLLKENGFNGFLIGEQFMKHAKPEKACHELISKVQHALSLKTVGYEN
ncbi:indole-3-glycerol phosphate synthase TrpC [Flavobacterium sp. C4GT6]|uniref:indole-3-glycerol phosphate synthase TrpC n=1 Tax=Flavobacterium sp. C4GT6 TaxID=3103818 RepID=UPI002ED0AB0B